MLTSAPEICISRLSKLDLRMELWSLLVNDEISGFVFPGLIGKPNNYNVTWLQLYHTVEVLEPGIFMPGDRRGQEWDPAGLSR